METHHSQFKYVLQSLKVVGNLKENNRLSTRRDEFIIENTFLESAWRWLYSESRMSNLDSLEKLFHLAQDIYKTMYQQKTQLDLETLTLESPCFSQTDHQSLTLNLHRLAEAIIKALSGARTFKQTYKNDANTKARIEILIEQMMDFLQLYPLS